MIEVCGRSRNRKVIEGNLRKKEKKKRGRKGEGTEPREGILQLLSYGPEGNKSLRKKQEGEQTLWFRSSPQHARTAPEMRGLSLCLLGKAPHIKSSALQKDSPPITMIVTQLMCHQKNQYFFLLFQDPHVNAFFRQCQKREKDMSQSPTSNFVRSCKVT